MKIASLWSCEERKRVVADLPSFLLSVWDMKECEKEGMMLMFVRMGGGAIGIMRS